MDISGLAYQSISNLISCNDITPKNNREVFLLMMNELTSFFKSILNQQTINYSSLYALSFFIINQYNLDVHLEKKIREYYFKSKKLKEHRNKQIDSDYLNFALHTFIQIIQKIANIDLSESTIEYLKTVKFSRKSNFKDNDDDRISLINVILVRKQNAKLQSDSSHKNIILCSNDELEDFELFCDDIWKETEKILFDGMRMNLIDAKIKVIDSKFRVVCDIKSYIVLEPDYLIDVTEVAQSSDDKHYLHNFTKRYLNKGSSQSLVIGSIINTMFDELLINPDAEFIDLLSSSIKSRVLSFLVLLRVNGFVYKDFEKIIKRYYDNIKIVIQKLEPGDYSTEPTIIAPTFGIQGRLDLLIEDFDRNYAVIMELKSGKIPNVRYMVNVNGKNVQNDVWLEHIYQVTGYDILMNYIAPDINLNSCIIYIQDTNKPVRVIVIENFIKSRFINFRNWIAALDYKLRNGEFKVIEKIMEFPSIPAFNHLSPFAKDDIILFNKTYLRSSDLLKEWFKVCSKFISNEIYFSKIGNSESNQYSNSSFWKDELNVKLENRIILTDLNLNVLESDFQNMHLVFIRNKPEQKSVFRIGDIVLVYPENNQFNPTKNIIYKAYIKLINKKSIFISLRNKKVNKSRFLISDNWNLELDISDNNTKNQYSSIFELLLAPADKTAILLGISNQEMDNLEYHPELKLNSKQTELFNASINAKNYFLIQGPPGTGKTSYMLAALVLYYFGSTNKQLLITAYTNRAVEEIFESINKYISNDNILRVGTKTGNSSDKILLSILSESLTIKELQKRIDNTRIVISTISSLNTNKEIFQLKNFDIAIVDEASQILEPQIIGILTQVSKFILIGDEKQLPAVTLQKPSDLTINNDKLNEIELYNLGDSYFARMLKICEKNRWYKCFGSLNEQARMHKEIQDFPNIYFYNNILQTICDEQQHGSRLFQENNNSSLEQFLSGYRVCFIDCPIEYENKISFTESTIVKKIINIINHNKPIIHKYNVGVISPFKLQCNNISMELSEELRELVTVDTVERYQGSQRDIIIISMAVNSKSLLDRTISESNNSNIDRKLNVAITRAKEHLIMVGNSEILVLSENYKNFINYCKSKNSYSKLDQFIN